jgi:hypothetical protein
LAKPLVFQFGETEFAFQLNKVDRSKLYGYKEVEVLDEKGRRCELATIADDGRTVVGKGGTGFGYVSASGEWCEKVDLTPVDPEGNVIQPVPSSYAAATKLFETVTADEFLRHNIRLVYALDCESDVSELAAELKKGTIFSFPYSYRGGLEADAAFLLLGNDGNIFLAVGNPTDVEFVGLQQPVSMSESDEVVEEADLMDFDMI